MGYNDHIEDQEFTRIAPDKFVCADCVEDSFLKDEIEKHLAKRKCDYCGKGGSGDVAAPVSAIMEPIAATFSYYFEYPDHAGVPYDGGGYAVDLNITTEDALRHLGLECQEELFADVSGSIGNDTLWVEAADGLWLGEHQSEFLSSQWAKFVQTVKHQSRFFFSSSPPSARKITTSYTFLMMRDWFRKGPPSARKITTSYTPSEILAQIGKAVSSQGLVRTWPMGTRLFRARERKTNDTWSLDDATQLGPPKDNKARTQRMSPAGISYFYLAKERETALAEVIGKPPCRLAIGRFSLRRNLCLLDLTQLPSVSVFDHEHRSQHEIWSFLTEFSRLISQPVEKDGQEHIEYVPTQVLSEYFAKIYKKIDGNPLDGMVYHSALRETGINIVLFPPQQDQKGFMGLAELIGTEEVTFQNWTDFCRKIKQTSMIKTKAP